MGLRLRAVAAGVLALTLVGCGSRDSAAGPKTVDVTMRDYHIAAPASVPAGRVRFDLRNNGPDTHEMLVIRGRAGHLPLRRDGVTVDEDGLGRNLVGSVEGAAPGTDHKLTVHLSPGRYVLICNMTGHYLGGMRTDVVVR